MQNKFLERPIKTKEERIKQLDDIREDSDDESTINDSINKMLRLKDI